MDRVMGVARLLLREFPDLAITLADDEVSWSLKGEPHDPDLMFRRLSKLYNSFDDLGYMCITKNEEPDHFNGQLVPSWKYSG